MGVIAFFRGSEIERMGYFFVEQGDVPHLFYGFDEMERESLNVALGDFFDVTDVLFRKNDLFDARTLGRQYFFFDTSDGKYLAT